MNYNEQVYELNQQLKQIHVLGIDNYDNSVDLLSTKQLSPLINSLPYLPYTTSSLRYSSVAYFLNDIIINNRKVIVEFGSGISTIFLSKLIQQLNLREINVVSIDNNQEWLNIIHNYISKDQANFNNIQLIQADLKSCFLALNENSWYDIEKLIVLENFKGKVDCVLVDGPEAWNKEIELSRYPALPFIYDFLAKDCSVFLDDTNRMGEESIVKRWNEGHDFKTEKLNSSFTRLYRGVSFNIK